MRYRTKVDTTSDAYQDALRELVLLKKAAEAEQVKKQEEGTKEDDEKQTR